MKKTARFYSCVRCYCQVVLCSDCDHGNIYCGTGCAQQARRESLRAAGQRYQNTFNGRRHHAARQQRYRENHKKVTHHGSISDRPASSSAPTNTVLNTEAVAINSTNHCRCCHRCKRPVSAFLRLAYLQQCSTTAGAQSIAIRGP